MDMTEEGGVAHAAGASGGARQGPVKALVVGLLRPQLPILLLAVLLMSIQSLSLLLQPWLAGDLFSRFRQSSSTAGLLWVLFLLVCLQAWLGYVVAIVLQKVSGRLVADIGTAVYRHLQSLPLAWHNERQKGDVLSLLMGDARRLGSFMTGTVAPLLPLLLTFFGALAMTLKIAPPIGLALAVVFPLIFVALRWTSRRLRPIGAAVLQSWADQSAQAEQNLSMLPVIKAFAAEDLQASRYGDRTDAVYRAELRQVRVEGAIAPMVRVAGIGAVLLMLGVWGDRVSGANLDAGQLISLILYGVVLITPLSQLAATYGSTMAALGAMERLDRALAAAPESHAGSHTLQAPRGELKYQGIAFSYPGRAPLFAAFDLDVGAGETVALTGANGAGKSTLAHLLLRLIEPDSGRILIDGVDIADVRLESLRSSIGLVSQQVQLFNASVAENIAYGRSDADRAMIESAARRARAHDFVMSLPRGYDTVVGDQGVKLSGGQKQRIALARALLKEPAILILDEATAMFDPEGEREFIRECHDLFARRTVLLITHRPASLALADRIVWIEDGKALERDLA